MTIYTVGHSTRDLNEFIALLKKYGIRQLFDIRRFPTSKKYPHFRRETLQDALPAAGIEYHFLGDELGGYRTGGYEKYMQSDLFLKGIERLLATARDGEACLMCAEMLYFRCHRRFVADYLMSHGIEVRHIVDEKRIIPHQSDLLTQGEQT